MYIYRGRTGQISHVINLEPIPLTIPILQQKLKHKDLHLTWKPSEQGMHMKMQPDIYLQ